MVIKSTCCQGMTDKAKKKIADILSLCMSFRSIFKKNCFMCAVLIFSMLK